MFVHDFFSHRESVWPSVEKYESAVFNGLRTACLHNLVEGDVCTTHHRTWVDSQSRFILLAVAMWLVAHASIDLLFCSFKEGKTVGAAELFRITMTMPSALSLVANSLYILRPRRDMPHFAARSSIEVHLLMSLAVAESRLLCRWPLPMATLTSW